MTDPDAILEFPGQPPISCHTLEEASGLGFVAANLCDLPPGEIAGTCGCAFVPIASTDPSVSALVSALVSAPGVNLPLPPSPGFPSCNVCGEGNDVMDSDAIVNMPGKLPISCATLEEASDLGFVATKLCELVPSNTTPCGCD